MKLKDIVYAAIAEDYSTANNIFGSELAKRIEDKLEERKISLVQENWFSDARSGAIDHWNKGGMSQKDIDSFDGDAGGLAGRQAFGQGAMTLAALGATFAVLKSAAMIPSALKGMKQAKRFGKLGPNLKYIQKWFPTAKPGSEVMLAFESSSGSLPSHQYIKYEQIAIILAALSSKNLQHNEKQMIVNGIDQSQESFNQITTISVKAVERDGDLKKLAAYQGSQYNEENISEAGKGRDWESWGRSVGSIFDVGSTATSSIKGGVEKITSKMDADAQYAQEKNEKEKGRIEADLQNKRNAWSDVIDDSQQSYSLKQKKETAKEIEKYLTTSEGRSDYIARNLHKKWETVIEPSFDTIASIREFSMKTQSRLTKGKEAIPIRGRQSTTLGYINLAAAKCFVNWMKNNTKNENDFANAIESNNLADMSRMLEMAKFHPGSKRGPKGKEAAILDKDKKADVETTRNIGGTF